VKHHFLAAFVLIAVLGSAGAPSRMDRRRLFSRCFDARAVGTRPPAHWPAHAFGTNAKNPGGRGELFPLIAEKKQPKIVRSPKKR
jgi:hypothetical protein